MSLDLRLAEFHAKRYVRHIVAEANILGFSGMTAFAKQIGQGTVSLAPTPDDKALEYVGKFMWEIAPLIHRRVLFAAYDGSGYSAKEKAEALLLTRRQYFDTKDAALILLSGYLYGMDAGDL
jgi:hypothetical protein